MRPITQILFKNGHLCKNQTRGRRNQSINQSHAPNPHPSHLNIDYALCIYDKYIYISSYPYSLYILQ
uniref:Uncharacterized protein n=1 Tax=Anguilla anguilla TaxID=7936 RepID=A0A0E9WL20_ANGAN